MRLVAQSLLEHFNGSPDAAPGLIHDGVNWVLKSLPYVELAEFDTPNWVPAKAQAWTTGQIMRFADKIKGIVAANDGMAGGVIAALKAGDLSPLPAAVIMRLPSAKYEPGTSTW